MSLLNQLRYNFPIINVFSGSEADNPYYSLCIPKLLINTTVTRKGLKQFINRQRLALNHDTPLKDALLVLDDCFESPAALDNDMMPPRPRWPTPRPRGRAPASCTNRAATCGAPCGASVRATAAALPRRPAGGDPRKAVCRGPAAVGAIHHVRHLPVPLSELTRSQIVV